MIVIKYESFYWLKSFMALDGKCLIKVNKSFMNSFG